MITWKKKLGLDFPSKINMVTRKGNSAGSICTDSLTVNQFCFLFSTMKSFFIFRHEYFN